MFRSSLAHHQGVQLYSCIEQLLSYIIVSNIRNCGEIISVDLQRFKIVNIIYFTYL